jgi:hypothetical protein
MQSDYFLSFSGLSSTDQEAVLDRIFVQELLDEINWNNTIWNSAPPDDVSLLSFFANVPLFNITKPDDDDDNTAPAA